MKRLILLAMALFFLTGCAMTKVATDTGVAIGDSFQQSAEKGEISAEQSIKAWPYVSGQIKGLMADNYKIELMPMAQDIISRLDELATKEVLTVEEKGFIIGSYVRLEAIAVEYAWDRYGVSILNLVKSVIGG